MIVEFFDENGTFSHIHLIAENEQEQMMIERVQGELIICRDASQPQLLGLRRKTVVYSQGEAHGLVYQGWMDRDKDKDS